MLEIAAILSATRLGAISPCYYAGAIDPFSIGGIVLEVIFFAVLGRFAWKQRQNKFVFWGWIAVIALLAGADIYFELMR